MGWKSKEIRNKYAQDLAHKRRREGSCIQCGSPSPGRAICLQCYQYMNNRRRNNKKIAIDLLGGQCMMCGYKTDILAVYEFHHIDPNTKKDKSIDPAQIISSWAKDKVHEELEKCMLLCANCHRIIHWGSEMENGF